MAKTEDNLLGLKEQKCQQTIQYRPVVESVDGRTWNAKPAGFTASRVESGVDLQLWGGPAAVDNHEISLQLCIELMISWGGPRDDCFVEIYICWRR